MEQKYNHPHNIFGVFTCLHSIIAITSIPFQGPINIFKKLLLIHAQSQNFIWSRLKYNINAIITLTLSRQSTKLVKQIWQIAI